MKTLGERYYSLRGYVLAVFLIPLVAARLQSANPLREPWLIAVLIGMLLRLWAGAHIGPHSNGITFATGPRARSGPYLFLRHPLYLSNLAVATGLIGFANCLPPIWSLGLWVLCFAHHALLIAMENSLASSEAMTALPAGWKTALNRQGRNIAYTLGCVVLLSLISRFSLTLFP